jgi:uncharacterized protein (DUF362 family)/Pyruvate/2-oxoacid:ferredoxin oxidoreductase delta subunit
MTVFHRSRRGFLEKAISFFAFVVLWPLRTIKTHAQQAQDSTGPAPAPLRLPAVPNGIPAVSVSPCENYDLETVYKAVKKALDDIGYSVPVNKRVLIKPNIMAQNAPSQHATTHPAVVDALCRIFTGAGCGITIGDSSAFYQKGGTLGGMRTTGMAAVAAKYGAQVLAFEKTAVRKITAGAVLNPFWITRALFDHDVVVDVPKLKVHQLARYSGAIKNMYGCVPGGAKQVYHEKFQNRPDYKEFWGGPLVDVFLAAGPDLSVMDAVYGLDKDGPAATGTPRYTGVILASVNAPALDVVACRMVGFDPRWAPAVRAALERGLADENKITVFGTVPSIPYVKLPDPKPGKPGSFHLDDYMFHQVIMTPVVSPSRCPKGCSACVPVCGPGAISLGKNGAPVIDYTICIRCYCCAEQCPRQAISLKGGFLNHVIQGVRRVMKI